MTWDCEKCHWDKQKAQHFKDCPCKCHETAQAVPEIPRCEKCGWPLADSVDKGCVVGNCSMRPIPKKHAEDSIKFWSDKYDEKVDELHEMWKEARSFEGSFNSIEASFSSAMEKIDYLESRLEAALGGIKKVLDKIESSTNGYCYGGDYLGKELIEIKNIVYSKENFPALDKIRKRDKVIAASRFIGGQRIKMDGIEYMAVAPEDIENLEEALRLLDGEGA